MLPDHRVIQYARIAAEIAYCRALEDLAFTPVITMPDDILGMKSPDVITRVLGNRVIERRVDQIDPLSRES